MIRPTSSPARIRRFRPRSVRHVSIAGVVHEGVTLFHLLGRRALLDDSADIVADRFIRGITHLLRSFRPDFFYVGGGMSEAGAVRAAIDRWASAPIVLSRGGRFVGEAGGLSIGGPSAVIFDVGQTAIKVSHGGSRRVHDRPPADREPDGYDVAGISFIKEVIASELRAAAAGSPAVLAVPGDVGDGLAPGVSNYRWQGRADAIGGLLPPDDGDREVLVLNDAELAAESARLEVNRALGSRCFVLTLGHAPGGALLSL
jgi:predicted NBD/HSP70 family sugar kinase